MKQDMMRTLLDYALLHYLIILVSNYIKYKYQNHDVSNIFFINIIAHLQK